MKDTEERKLKKVYLAPKIEVVEFRVEGGFAEFSGMLLERLDKGDSYSNSDFSYQGGSPDETASSSGESFGANGDRYGNLF